MPSKGCVPPKDLNNRARLSFIRHGARLMALPLALQPSYDARQLGLVPPIKDQGNCGSCWDFSGVGVAEMASILAGVGDAKNVNWSEQSVLDCGSNGGCDGDWPETALEQAKNSGIANTKDYPYRGGAGSCRNVPHPNTVLDYGYVGSSDAVPSVQELKNALLAHGVLSVAVAVDDAWMNYGSGVFFDTGASEIDHAVMLVGWQDSPTVPGDGYWIVRNQWGTSWGEGGYMRCKYGANRIGYGAMWATCKSVSPVPPPVPPVPPPPIPPTPPVPPAPPITIPVTVTGKTKDTPIQVPGRWGGTTTVIVPGQTVTLTGNITIPRQT